MAKFAVDVQVFFELLDDLNDSILILNQNQTIVYMNHKVKTVFKNADIGDPFASHVRHLDVREAIESLLDSADHTVKNVEITMRSPVERMLCLQIYSLSFDGEKWIGIQIIDQTEQKRTAKMHADFVANVSHELRTPLASICGFIETLQMAAKNDPIAQEKFLEIMAQQAKRMQKLIDSLLSLTRIELNRHIEPNTQVNLVPLLDRVTSALKPLAEAKNIRIMSLLTSKTIDITGANDELEQVFQNLIENAIKYSPKDSKIYIEQIKDKDYLNLTGICIADQGHGIAEEFIPRLTERFYRVDEARNRSQGGAGLGLSIVQQIIKRHKGQLDITSEIGKGSRFTVYLPVWGG